jgi:hypothetical protein
MILNFTKETCDFFFNGKTSFFMPHYTFGCIRLGKEAHLLKKPVQWEHTYRHRHAEGSAFMMTDGHAIITDEVILQFIWSTWHKRADVAEQKRHKAGASPEAATTRNQGWQLLAVDVNSKV